MLLAAVGGDFYNVMLIVHIAAVAVAFAPVLVAPILQVSDRSAGEEMVKAQSKTMNTLIQRWAMGALVLVLLTGLGMVIDSDDVISMGDAWISASFVLWIIIAGVISAVVGMGERVKSEGDMGGMRFVTLGSAAAGVLGVVMLYVMIFKPGM